MRSIPKEIAFLTLPTLISAVSLADLTPRAQNLPQSCENIYTSQIPGCSEKDFKFNQCTSSCFYALQSLKQPIEEACGDQGVTGQNLIVAYLLGVGPEQICQNADQLSGSPEPSKTSFMPSSSSSAKTTTRENRSTVTSGVLTVPSIAPSGSTTLVYDTSKTPTTGSQSFETSSVGTSSLPDQLNTNDHSGGGSPFDTMGNVGGAATLSCSVAITFLSAAAALIFNFR